MCILHLRVFFSYFHGQNKCKVKDSVLCFVSKVIIIKVKKVAISALKYNFLVENRLKLRFLNVTVKGRIVLLKLANVYKTGGM